VAFGKIALRLSQPVLTLVRFREVGSEIMFKIGGRMNTLKELLIL
jgi:hypothetical protein